MVDRIYNSIQFSFLPGNYYVNSKTLGCFKKLQQILEFKTQAQNQAQNAKIKYRIFRFSEFYEWISFSVVDFINYFLNPTAFLNNLSMYVGTCSS